MTASRIAIAAFIGLCTVSAFGQIPQPPPASTDPAAQMPNPATPAKPDKPQDPTKPQDKRIGANQPDETTGKSDKTSKENEAKGEQEGPEILDDSNATPEQKASAEYSGPAVLSRGISASEPMNPKNVKFTPQVGLEYIVQTGITGLRADNGKLQNDLSNGVQLSYGLTGEKVFRHDVFSLNLTGNLFHYFQTPELDGTDNQLALTWRHKISKHLSFGIRESFQEYNRNNLLLSGSQSINNGVGSTLVTASPLTEVFDGRVISLFNEGNVTWQVNARLSLNLSGAGFFTRRAASALFGDTGYQSGADVAYRITRRVTAGAYYSYTHFDYIGTYGGSDINTVGLTYSIAFNPRTQLITRVGGSRVESTGLQAIELDPFLSMLFGTQASIQAVYFRNYAPDFNLQIRHRVQNLSLTLAYARGITPGNGVILTSTRESASAGANYKMRRKWNVAAQLGYDTLSGFGATSQKYASVFGGFSVYRNIGRQLEWHTRADYHHYTFDNTGFLRNNMIFSTGVVWTPGDILERLW